MRTAGLTLITAALFSALLIGLVSIRTNPIIVQNQVAHEARILREVVKSSTATLEPLNDQNTKFRVLEGNELTGYLQKIETTEGYNGTITAWLATDLRDAILNLATLEHEETPGIGDIINNDSVWLEQFMTTRLASHTYRLQREGGDFDHVTGATVTSRAYIAMLNNGMLEHLEHKASYPYE